MPIEMREIRTARRFCAVPLLFRSLSVIFMVLFAGLLGTGLRAQTISIKLVNGRNGTSYGPWVRECGGRSHPP